MASITIRDVPEDTRDELAARAAGSGRSLQEYLRHELIELARRPDAAVGCETVEGGSFAASATNSSDHVGSRNSRRGPGSVALNPATGATQGALSLS
jgi:plasmid stability protein